MSADEKQVGGDHYKKGKPNQEHWNLTIDLGWDYFQSQTIKYLMRWKYKGGLKDLEKAKHFLEKYIENYEQYLPKPIEVKAIGAAEMAALWPMFEELQQQFLFEGGHGDGQNLYRCRRCNDHIYAMNPLQAHERHGDCAGPSYVNQG
jgi:hypothetical protein